MRLQTAQLNSPEVTFESTFGIVPILNGNLTALTTLCCATTEMEDFFLNWRHSIHHLWKKRKISLFWVSYLSRHEHIRICDTRRSICIEFCSKIVFVMYLKSGTVGSLSDSADVDAARAFGYFFRVTTWIGYTSRPFEMSAHSTLSSGTPVIVRICILNWIFWAHAPLRSATQSYGVSSELFVVVRLAPWANKYNAIRVLPLRQAICLNFE